MLWLGARPTRGEDEEREDFVRDGTSGATTLEEMRADYDWREAFAYAGHGQTEEGDADQCYGSPDVRRHPSDAETSLEPFGLGDVRQIVNASEGENDGPPWVAIGELEDGRWFYLEAGCDYTGWDCQAGGTAHVASSFEDLVVNCVTEDERERLALWPRAKLQELGVDPQAWAREFAARYGPGSGNPERERVLGDVGTLAGWFGAAMGNAAAEGTAAAVARLTDVQAGVRERTESGLVVPSDVPNTTGHGSDGAGQ